MQNDTVLMAALYDGNGDVPVDLALLEDVMLLPTGANKTNIESFDLTGYINDVNQQYTQVLMEYGKNGKYNSIYSYGLQRLGADYSGAQTVYLYDEWGNLLSGKVHTNGFYSDLYLYNGEATDITTGLQYLRARYYDPGMAGSFSRTAIWARLPDRFGDRTMGSANFSRYYDVAW